MAFETYKRVARILQHLGAELTNALVEAQKESDARAAEDLRVAWTLWADGLGIRLGEFLEAKHAERVMSATCGVCGEPKHERAGDCFALASPVPRRADRRPDDADVQRHIAEDEVEVLEEAAEIVRREEEKKVGQYTLIATWQELEKLAAVLRERAQGRATIAPGVTPSLTPEQPAPGEVEMRAEGGARHPLAPSEALESMLIADNKRMRAAGSKLAEAAMRVIREYDGTHRLALAASAWLQAVADEGGRAAAPQARTYNCLNGAHASCEISGDASRCSCHCHAIYADARSVRTEVEHDLFRAFFKAACAAQNKAIGSWNVGEFAREWFGKLFEAAALAHQVLFRERHHPDFDQRATEAEQALTDALVALHRRKVAQ